MHTTLNFGDPSRARARRYFSLAGCLAAAAVALGCGDESTTTSAAASSGSQSGSGGAGTGGGGQGGSGGEATAGTGGAGGTSGTGGAGGAAPNAAPVIIPASDSGHDRFFGVTFDAKGNIYATGVVASSTEPTADYAMMVTKLLPSGELDPAFGTKGITIQNVAVGTNGELARGIVVQSTGKIVIAGTVEHAGATDARDRDIAVLRFNADGSPDMTFGTKGVVTLDLSDGEVVGANYVADGHWGLNIFTDDDLLITGAQKRMGGTDTDFAVLRLNPDGTRDSTFGTNGLATLDIKNQSASPRTGTILPDGSVVVTGYNRDADSVVSPVIFKLTGAGQLDPTFGVNGVFNQIVLANVTEAYGAALQGTKLVTAGYGKNDAASTLNWVSLRITSSGMLDPTYGTSGVAQVDVAGFNDNARGLIALPDERVMIIGGGRPTADEVDAMVGVLLPDGKPDSTFAPDGWKLYDLGGPNDHFWSIALSPDKTHAAIVGVKGAAMGAGNDDAALLLLPVGK